MKRILLPILGAAAILVAMRGRTETNSIPVATSTDTNRSTIDIQSDSMKGMLTNKTMVAVYRGNVRVNHPRWWTRSEIMTARLPVGGRRIESLVLESNVLLFSLDEKGRTNNGRGDSAVYSYSVNDGTTNETVVLNGKPAVVVTAEITMRSSRIECDLIKGTFDGGTNYSMTINAEGLGSSTNGPSLDLFKHPSAR